MDKNRCEGDRQMKESVNISSKIETKGQIYSQTNKQTTSKAAETATVLITKTKTPLKAWKKCNRPKMQRQANTLTDNYIHSELKKERKIIEQKKR